MKKKKDDIIYYKTQEEIELIRAACDLNSRALALVAERIRPGVRGSDIDQEVETFLRDHNATPGFKGLYGCPSTLLISNNEAVVHGLPSDKVFQEGDVVSVDCGTVLDGYYGDTAYTFVLGEVSEETMKLCQVTKASLYLGIEQARIGKRIGDISHAVQYYCERIHRYGCVRELVGHGLGRSLHEAPQVPNFGKRGSGTKIQEGLVIAIEPMITQGRRHIETAHDGWTILTKDRKPSAHYEHTVAVTKDGPDILSTHDYLEEEIRKNPNVLEVASYETAAV